MKRLALLLLPSVVLVSGCASTDRVMLDSTKRVPTAYVDVYKVGDKPKRTYKEIARLSYYEEARG